MKKDTLKIVIAGHVDHGKSTLIGRLLLETGSLPKERIARVRRLSKGLGRDTELAYLSDQLKEERERGMTIDTTRIFFKTRKRNYIIIDAPGHLGFIKNMITGASSAEAAILIIDIREGIMEQTRRHAYLMNLLGIDKVIAVINKMDLADRREKRFNALKAEVSESLKIKPLFIVPVSARQGTNISKKSSGFSWYKGPALTEALDSLGLYKKTAERPLRFSVQDIYKMDGEEIIAGRVASGSIKQGQKVLLPHSGEVTIKAIKVFGKHKHEIREGQNAGLILNERVSAERGDVIVQNEGRPKLTTGFKGNIFWMSREPLRLNESMTMRCATQEIECTAERIEDRIDSSTLETIQEDANQLKINEAGLVIFRTKRPVLLEKFTFIEELGRFVIESKEILRGAGIIASLGSE